MKSLKRITLFLFLLMLTVTAKAENVSQSFSTSFAGTSYAASTDITKNDGWTYADLMRETTAAGRFDGTAACRIKTATTATAVLGHITSPEKTGGVGLVSFWCKSQSGSASNPDWEIAVQTSEDGETFTTEETIFLKPTQTTNANYVRFHKYIGKPNAKYVRLELQKKTAQAVVNVDEIVITDCGINLEINPDGLMPGKEVNFNGVVAFPVNTTGLSSELNLDFKATTTNFNFDQLSNSLADLSIDGLKINFNSATPGIFSTILTVYNDQLPKLFFPITIAALDRNIAQDFEGTGWKTAANETYSNNGWDVVNGCVNTSKTSAIPFMYAGDKFFYLCEYLVTPEKLGGVGYISFMHRTEAWDASLGVEVYISEDKSDDNAWTLVKNFQSESTVYTKCLIPVNNANAKYVKIKVIGATATNPVSRLLMDNLIVTANDGKAIPEVEATNAYITATDELPDSGFVKLNLSNITSDLTVETANSQFTLGATTIEQAEANGVYNLPISFTGTTDFFNGTVTISGGGLFLPVTLPVAFYKEQESLFANFDEAKWAEGTGTTSTIGIHYTATGWKVINGSRDTNNKMGSSGADINMAKGGFLITPPLSSGIGSIQFYVKLNKGNNVIGKIYTSIDGINWTKKTEIPIVDAGNHARHDVIINDQTAKFARIEITTPSNTINPCYVDNITVTKCNEVISDVKLENSVSASAELNTEKIVTVKLRGVAIKSPITIEVAEPFSFAGEQSIIVAPEDINDKVYDLNVKYAPTEGVYHTSSILITGDDFRIAPSYSIEGFVLEDFLYANFETGSAFPVIPEMGNNSGIFNGWFIYQGARTGTGYANGRSAVNLNPTKTSENSRIVSPPKINGVGSIQFLYKSNNSLDANIVVNTYKTKGGEPTKIDEFEVKNAEYKLFKIAVNDPNALFVELVVLKPTEGNARAIYIDDFAVSACNKSIPAVIMPEMFYMAALAGEEQTIPFEITLDALNKPDSLGMVFLESSNNSFAITPIKITPETDKTVVNGEIKYTPANGSAYVDAKLTVTGKGMLYPLSIPVVANVLKSNFTQNFNATGWSTSTSTFALEGWYIKNGKRNSSTKFLKGGSGGSLALAVTAHKTGSVTSPAKLGGIKEISFSYYNMAVAMKLYVETSPDGIVWTKRDSLVFTANNNGSTVEDYSLVLNDPDARRLRLSTSNNVAATDQSFYIDHISIVSMPYLRQIGVVEEMTTNTLPTIPVTLAGHLDSKAAVKMSGGESSNFTLSVDSIAAENLADDVEFILNATLVANTSGVYQESILIVNEDAGINISIPLKVTYNKPYLELVGTVDDVTTSTLPVNIPVTVKGLIVGNIDITLSGANADKFSLEKNEITAEELAEGNVSFNVTFNGVDESGEYVANIAFGDILNVPLKVTYNKPYVELVAAVGDITTYSLPLSFPLILKGLITETVNITLTGDAADKFTLSKTTITPAEFEAGNVFLTFTFNNVTESGVYEATVKVGDFLDIPLKVTYKKPHMELVGTVDELTTSTLPLTIPITVKGFSPADITISHTGAAADKFTLSKTTITTAELEAGNVSFDLTFNGVNQSGVYEATVKVGNFLTIPVKVTYNKPYMELVGTVDEVTTSILPTTIPVTVKGLIVENQTVSLTGAAADKFTLSKTTITPAELEAGNLSFNLTFNGVDQSGVYEATVKVGDFLTIPVKVTYNKPYMELVGTVDEVTTSTLPATIPVTVKGLIVENQTVSLTGAAADKFTLSKTTITPAELEAGNVSFNLTFNGVDQSGVYEATVKVGDFLTIPVKVTYNKPYMELVGTVAEVTTSTLPATIPVTVKGLIVENVTVSLTGAAADKFTLSKTTITPAELEAGNVSFNLTFNGVDQSGVYEATVKVGDFLTIPVKVTYNKPYMELVGTVEEVTTSTLPVSIPVTVKGLINESVNITLITADADDFTVEKATITPTELEAGNLSFNVVLNAEKESGIRKVYEATVKVGDFLTIPVKVIYDTTAIGDLALEDALVYISNDGVLNVKNISAGLMINVYNLHGEILHSSMSKSTEEYIGLSLAKGVYIVRVANNSYKVIYK